MHKAAKHHIGLLSAERIFELGGRRITVAREEQTLFHIHILVEVKSDVLSEESNVLSEESKVQTTQVRLNLCS
jgi:hypothetical protein